MALVINSTTGVIDVSASTAGTYVVSYTVGTDVATQTITIFDTPTASISGATSYCAGTGGVTLVAGGSQGGDTFSWNKDGSSTGLTTSQITSQTDGVYTVAITRPTGGESGCTDTSANFTVTELPSQNTNFAYQNSSYAQDGTDPTPTITGDSGGTFTASPSGLSINSSTGQIDLSASSVNTYTITYSLPAPCPSTTNRTLGITAASYTSVYSVGLDGVNDYLQENYYNALSGQQSFTISFWVYITGTISFQPFVTTWTNPYLYMIRYNAGYIQFYQRTSTNTNKLTQAQVSLEKNRWYNIIAVKDGTTNRLYLDGVIQATLTNTATMKTANVGARIGNYQTAYGGFLIDEVTQYTSAFSNANAVSQYNNGVPTTPVGSPVNWWKMGEDSAGNATTIANDGSGSNFLTRTNGAGYFTEPAGIFNQRSIDFDGVNDFVTFGDNNAWSFTGEEEDSPLSVSAWIKADTTTGGILGKYGSSGYEWLFYLINGQIRFIIRNSTSGYPYKLIYSPNLTISTNTWTHVAVTYNGQYFNSDFGVKIYKDGSEITNLTKSSSGSYQGMINYSTPMTMGSASGGTYFNGKIDECALFNYTLSSNAISEIYNSGSPQIDLNNLTNATTDPIMWARGGDRDSYSTLTNRGSLNLNGTYTNMTEDDINFDVKT